MAIQTVNSDPNTLYTVSFAYSYDLGFVGCSLYSAYGGGQIYNQKLTQPTNGWAIVSIPNVRGATGGANLEIELWCSDASVNAHLSLDDVSWIAQ